IKKLVYLLVANSWGDRSRLRMTQDLTSPWQAPSSTTFSNDEPETLAADLPDEPLSVAAMVTSRNIKQEAEEDAVVTHVADLDVANLIYTIPEETEVDIEMAPVVDIVTEVVDEEEMPTVQVDVTGESPAEQPRQYKLIPSEESDAEAGVPETGDKLLWPPRILDNYPCPVLDRKPALSSGIRPAVASEPT
ncbi:MAG: hypothetical protein ACKPKO_44235, partial [Candidatus Fonsibacter sp.]